MKSINATLASFVVVTALAAPAMAQEPLPLQPPSPQAEPTQPQDRQSPPMRAEAPAVRKAMGQLVRVDADTMTIVIKGTDDKEQQFRYTDATKVEGAQEQVSGLSTKAGSAVTISYVQGTGETRVATKVKFDEHK